MSYFVSSLPWAFIAMIIVMVVCTCLSACTAHQSNLEDVAKEVVEEGTGVIIEIKPQKK